MLKLCSAHTKEKQKEQKQTNKQTKNKSVLFFAPWLPEKSDLGKVLKRALKLCNIVFTLFSLIHMYTYVVLFFNDMYFWLLNSQKNAGNSRF